MFEGYICPYCKTPLELQHEGCFSCRKFKKSLPEPAQAKVFKFPKDDEIEKAVDILISKGVTVEMYKKWLELRKSSPNTKTT